MTYQPPVNLLHEESKYIVYQAFRSLNTAVSIRRKIYLTPCAIRFDILSDLSGFLSGIYSGILFDTYFGTLSGILSSIIFGIRIQTCPQASGAKRAPQHVELARLSSAQSTLQKEEGVMAGRCSK